MDPVTTLATPVKITFDSAFDLTIDQLRDELTKLGHNAKGWTKPAMQKCLCKILTDKSNVERVSEIQLKLKQLEIEERIEERRLAAELNKKERSAEERRLDAELRKGD